METLAWLRRHPLNRHDERPPVDPVDGNRRRRYRKDRERTLDDKGNPTGQRIRRDGLTSGERAEA